MISLADIGQVFSGLSGKSAEDFGNGERYITYLNVYQNDIIDDSAVGYVSIQDGEDQNMVSYGDILFTLSSETANEVGITSVYLSNKKDKYLNSFCFGYRLNDFQTLNPEYLPYCFSSTRFRKHILPFAQGSTRYNLHKVDFIKSKFRVPTITNQKAIANIMSTHNRKLTTDKHLLVRYQEQKSYLLQKLFI
ncbi:hypothetical protein SDC9_90595 [bioreactor metagenome]|uniref:Type I restriction modification DNA specificity domain-containing protein n=1 Tax=bioreactor metagenome TaxID=1076179 RepID=A0A644ZT33_9ZZZZ